MHADERHQAILRELKARHAVRVTDVARQLGTSVVTIRRDIRQLADLRLLVPVHGGAALPTPSLHPPGGGRPARSVTIGMVVPSPGGRTGDIVRAAQAAVSDRGGRLALGIASSKAGEREQVGRLIENGAEAIAITPTDPDHGWLTHVDVPVVLVERRADRGHARLEHAVCDHGQGAFLAVRYLASLGHRAIALITRPGAPEAGWVTEGYHDALLEAGLEPGLLGAVPEARATSPLDRTCSFTLLTRAVRACRVDAVLVHDGHAAMMLLDHLDRSGLSVPGDISVIAYDSEFAALADTPLTSVALPRRTVADAAVDLLYRRLYDRDAPPQRVTVTPELRVRQSTGRAEGHRGSV